MTKEQEFKTRFTGILQHLQETGSKDAESMWLLGSLASELAGNLKTRTWTGAKDALNGQSYQVLLTKFEQEGNDHHAAGRNKHAYAIQVLAASLIARTQRGDPQMQSGEVLLDRMIDHAVSVRQKATTSAH